eukprot:8131760-Pyramimonas_sp.AAC.1
MCPWRPEEINELNSVCKSIAHLIAHTPVTQEDMDFTFSVSPGYGSIDEPADGGGVQVVAPPDTYCHMMVGLRQTIVADPDIKNLHDEWEMSLLAGPDLMNKVSEMERNLRSANEEKKNAAGIEALKELPAIILQVRKDSTRMLQHDLLEFVKTRCEDILKCGDDPSKQE